MILDDQQNLINSGRGYDSEAQAEFTADCYLSNHIAQDGDPCAGMRADGEPLTGIDAIGNYPSIVHPGNDTVESSPADHTAAHCMTSVGELYGRDRMRSRHDDPRIEGRRPEPGYRCAAVYECLHA